MQVITIFSSSPSPPPPSSSPLVSLIDPSPQEKVSDRNSFTSTVGFMAQNFKSNFSLGTFIGIRCEVGEFPHKGQGYYCRAKNGSEARVIVCSCPESVKRLSSSVEMRRVFESTAQDVFCFSSVFFSLALSSPRVLC